MKHANGEVWKAGRNEWKVQFDNGILTFRTKREADLVSRVFYPNGAKITTKETAFGTSYSYPVHKKIADLVMEVR